MKKQDNKTPITKEELSDVLKDYPSKKDLKKELSNYPTKEDLRKELSNYPTKEDLRKELSNYPTKDDLKRELSNYPTKKDLKNELSSYPTKKDLNDRFTAFQDAFRAENRHEFSVLREELAAMISTFTSHIYTAIDPLIKDLETRQQEREIASAQSGEINARIENHEKRITKLEHS